jgi:hypothetical protein
MIADIDFGYTDAELKEKINQNGETIFLLENSQEVIEISINSRDKVNAISKEKSNKLKYFFNKKRTKLSLIEELSSLITEKKIEEFNACWLKNQKNITIKENKMLFCFAVQHGIEDVYFKIFNIKEIKDIIKNKMPSSYNGWNLEVSAQKIKDF